MVTRKCAVCETDLPTPRRGGRPRIYCCRKCSRRAEYLRIGPRPVLTPEQMYARRAYDRELYRRRAAAREPEHRQCADCDTPLAKKPGPGRWPQRCPTCSERRTREREAQRAPARRPTPAERTCATCGTIFTPRSADHRIRFCSDPCRYAAWDAAREATDPRYRLRHRDRDHRRRARLLAAEHEPIRTRDVFNRDGWRCRICRRMTRDDVPIGHPRKANLGHIVALAAGGSHTHSNVCCLCHECNQRDGVNRLPIQLAIA